MTDFFIMRFAVMFVSIAITAITLKCCKLVLKLTSR